MCLIASNKLHTGVLWARTTLTSFIPSSLSRACSHAWSRTVSGESSQHNPTFVQWRYEMRVSLEGLRVHIIWTCKQRNVCLRFTEAPDWEHQEGYFFTLVHRSLTLKRLSTIRAPPPTRGADHQALRGSLHLAAEWVQFLSIRLSWVQLIHSSFLSEFR